MKSEIIIVVFSAVLMLSSCSGEEIHKNISESESEEWPEELFDTSGVRADPIKGQIMKRRKKIDPETGDVHFSYDFN